MKRSIIFFLAMLLGTMVHAQAPQAFKYQAVARDASGNVLVNKSVSFKISILSSSPTGTAVFSETHAGKTTNGFGLVELEIGKGASATGAFISIPWYSGTFYLKVEMDPAGGTAWQSMGTSQLLSVPYALHAKNVELEADGDATNELQKITISGTVLTLDKNGGSVTLPSGGTSGDNWGTQTVKTNTTLTGEGTPASPLGVANTAITPSWANIQNIPAGFADGTDNVDDADADATNEIQVMNLSGTVLSLSKGGGSVTLPSSGGGDNWGTQTVVTDATLTGNGTTATPLKIADNGITSGKIFDGTIVTSDLADNSVTNAKIIDTAVSTNKLANNAVTASKLASMGALNGQVLKWNGTAWNPAQDETGGGGFTLPYAGSASSSGSVFEISNTIASGAVSAIRGETVSGQGYGVYGRVTATNGENWGVYGTSTSEFGTGVEGRSTSTTGASWGVKGKSFSPDGIGVYGFGAYRGVAGESPGTEGRGVSGKATSGTGINYGVYGETFSGNGYGVFGTSPYRGVYGKADEQGVFGEATAPGGFGVYGKSTTGFGVYGNSENKGVVGISNASGGYGMYGEAPKYGAFGKSTGSGGRAVVGEATATASIGVQGIATNTSSTGVWGEGANQGVYGESSLSTGKGVYGMASSSTGVNYGIYGKTSSQAGYGVYGDATSAGGVTYGVYGKSASDLGVGVFGHASSLTGVGYGVWGKTESGYGWGVYGEAVNTTGDGLGVCGRSKSSTGCGVSGSSPKYGTYGGSTGSQGRAIWGEALGTSSIGVYGKALADNSTGVYAEGSKYDFYAAGPGTDYGTSSSIRWKKNLTAISDPIGKIKVIRGVFFDWDEAHGGKHDVGMIAEEVGKVLPEIVDYEENGTDAIGLDYSKITPLLLEAIKAQQAEIELLKNRVEKLEKLVGASAQK